MQRQARLVPLVGFALFAAAWAATLHPQLQPATPPTPADVRAEVHAVVGAFAHGHLVRSQSGQSSGSVREFVGGVLWCPTGELPKDRDAPPPADCRFIPVGS